MAIVAYRLEVAPDGRIDGSGAVNHDIIAVISDDGGENWRVVPEHHRTIVVPTSVVSAIMAMPHSTGPEKVAKNAAYKEALKTHLGDTPVPFVYPQASNWSSDGIIAFDAAWSAAHAERLSIDAEAALAASVVSDYITGVLGQEYPVRFNI